MLKVSGDILSHIKATAKSPLIFIPLGLVNAFKKKTNNPTNNFILVATDLPVIFVKYFTF